MTRIKWTEELIRLSAKKYATKNDWQKGCKASYLAAFRRGIHNNETIVGHMNQILIVCDYNSIVLDA